MENIITTIADMANSKAKVGVFLCRCGGRISSMIDLEIIEKELTGDPLVEHVEVIPFSCQAPGMDIIKERIAEKGLNRIVVAGCEYRVMLKNFETGLSEEGIQKGEVDVVNLRDYVASSNSGEPDALAVKGCKLVKSSVAGLYTLDSTSKTKVEFNGPVMVLGGGIATYSAAQELIRKGIETIIAVQIEDIEDEIRILHERYPGEREYHERLMKIMEEVDQSPLVKRVSVGELEKVMGVMGNYQVTFTSGSDRPPLVFDVSAIIAALDGEMMNQGADFGHNGKTVLCHTEIEEYMWLKGVPSHRMVFWINDLETKRPFPIVSTRTAWNIARYMRKNNSLTDITILYNNKIDIGLSGTERVQARKMGIKWLAYNGNIRPTVQKGLISYYDPEFNIERELEYDQLVLSPKRYPGLEQLKVAGILGLHVKEGEFLERNPQMVKPEQAGVDEKFFAGSARKPCDLRETLRQGKRAANKVAELVKQAKEGTLYAPRMVCYVDPEKCIGCGLCKEICDCGSVAPVEGFGGNIPKVIDPMVCTGGGTCAAACPYQALMLRNNTNDQREARVAVLADSLTENEVMGIGCNWGGTAAADHAGLKGMKSNERFYLLPVGCIGQLDPVVMGRAFLDGANSLLLIGCPPEECHHSYGVDHTWSRVLMIKKLFSLIGIERNRIALAHADLNKPEEYIRTVNHFVSEMDKLGPIDRTPEMKIKIQDLFDTLKNSRVRWVLGASLRRPWEDTYPSDQRNAMAYDETLTDVLVEEFIRTRIINLLKRQKEVVNLDVIAENLGEDRRKIQGCLSEMSKEGAISRIFKDRVPYYAIG